MRHAYGGWPEGLVWGFCLLVVLLGNEWLVWATAGSSVVASITLFIDDAIERNRRNHDDHAPRLHRDRGSHPR